MDKNDAEERVLIVAPLGQDANAIGEVLYRDHVRTEICRDLAECIAQIQTGAGAVLLTEEALELKHSLELFETLKAQPAWSELPLILLTIGGESHLTKFHTSVVRAARTVTLLERPIGSITLLRS